MEQAIQRWSRRIVPEGGPKYLAAARIATAVVGLDMLLVVWSPSLGTIPRELWSPPLGTAFLADVVPVSRSLAVVAAVLFTLGVVGTLVGARHPWPAAMAATALGYLGWVHHLSGKTDHYHHVLWFLVIIALSPASDAWSIDARRRKGEIRPRRQSDYSYPLAAMMVVLGFIYFFAGVAKLQLGGVEWIASDNLQNIIRAQWWQRGWEGVPFVDSLPVSRLLALSTVVFELVFLPAILLPRTRRYAAVAGLLFHIGTWAILGISFRSLQILYVVFFPWGDEPDPAPPEFVEKRSARARAGLGWAVIAALVVGVALVGISHVERAWPVAAYPTFTGSEAGLTSDRVVDLELRSADDQTLRLVDSGVADRYGSAHVLAMFYNSLAALHAGDDGPMDTFIELFERNESAGFGPVVAADSITLQLESDRNVVVARTRIWPAD